MAVFVNLSSSVSDSMKVDASAFVILSSSGSDSVKAMVAVFVS